MRATLLDLFFGPAQTGVYSKYAASLGCGACKEGAAVVFTPTCSPTHEQVGAGDPVQVWHCHLCQSPILGIHHHEHAKCSLHSLQAPCKPGTIGASLSFVCAQGVLLGCWLRMSHSCSSLASPRVSSSTMTFSSQPASLLAPLRPPYVVCATGFCSSKCSHSLLLARLVLCACRSWPLAPSCS